MHKILLLFLALPHLAFSGGLSHWWRDTPGGNTISYESYADDHRVMVHCGQMYDVVKDYHRVIDHVERWYFYQNHVVGIYWENGVRGYFIFAEDNCTCLTFTDLESFERQKKAMGIEPVFCTRWYSTYWGILTGEGDFAEGLNRIPLYLLIFGLIIFALIQLIRTRFSPKNRINQFLLLAFCFIALRVWLDIHPQSF